MKRRNFLKFASSAVAAKIVPVSLGISALAQQAQAESPNYGAVNVSAPVVMPQIINIFMYGGASELAGNLSNIEDINTNSQNAYTDRFNANMLNAATDNNPDNRLDNQDGQITANKFWKEAGGTYMEDMLASNDMTVYRTLYKQKSPTRSHRESIFMSHKGTLGIENAPGVGSRLALMMLENKSLYEQATLADGSSVGPLDEMTLPFISFEGESQTYANDLENPLPLYLKGLTMDDQFNNPYTQSVGTGASDVETERVIQALLGTREQELGGSQELFQRAVDGFDTRKKMVGRMEDLSNLLDGTTANGNLSSAEALGLTGATGYPDTSFGRQLEAAVTLAIHNPQTLYMAVGTPGLGGWDDHNNGVDRYPNRMNGLMETIKVAMAHINASNGVATINGGTRDRTDNIIINVFGDFGRLVNLNGSDGWDHANNQNLYTFGGAGVRPANEAAKLGQVVGETRRAGTPKTNNQYTVPTDDSLTWEPMSIAASIYEYFGATNPEVMTASAGDPDGDGSLASKLPAV